MFVYVAVPLAAWYLGRRSGRKAVKGHHTFVLVDTATGAADGAPADFPDDLQRVCAERQRVTVTAIGAGDHVVGVGRSCDADRDGLLATAQMRAAAHHAIGEQALDAPFDRADFNHAPELFDAVAERGAAGGRDVGIDAGHEASFHQACGARPVETRASICAVTYEGFGR